MSTSSSSTNLMVSLAVFVESGLLYSAWSIFLAVTYCIQRDVGTLAVDNMAVMAGIAFIMINVRTGLQELGGSVTVKDVLSSICVSRDNEPAESQSRSISMVYPMQFPAVAHTPELHGGDELTSAVVRRTTPRSVSLHRMTSVGPSDLHEKSPLP
ncbi:hypothetical protein PM082_020972 [Marasmius tenuissimus]|nr:hypothetical protein PM082_020972 [Marasmius tenuissimus]